MKEFVQLDKFGKLYIDKVLFESYYPIIFTCLNESKDIFISVCCQNNENGCKWLLGKTNGISIVKMLSDEITIRQLLLEHSSGKISVDYAENGYTVAYNNSDWDVNSPFLPKEDSYMYAEDGEFEEEIHYFMSLNDSMPYDTEHYKCVAQALETINMGTEPIAEALDVFVSAIGAISIPGEVVSTLKVFGKLCTNLVMNLEKYTNQGKYKLVYNGTFHVMAEDLGVEVESEDNNYYAEAA